MTLSLTVVMYHYVRPIAQSAYPRLKALDLADFHSQLTYLQHAHEIISPAQLRAALRHNAPLPANACLLTFDDGYSDHYAHVFPALTDRNLSGLFFAPASSLLRREPLEVNKIQVILATAKTPSGLTDALDDALRDHGLDVAAFRREHFRANRFDTPEVSYFKRMLQHALPQDLRGALVDMFFKTHVTTDDAGFADAFYLSRDQAREMIDAGMEFGAHGDRHLWHNQCDDDALSAEIQGSLRVIESLGQTPDTSFYCYPFGGLNPRVCDAARQAGFAGGFSVEPRVAQLGIDNPMALPRLDTNDMPK